MNDQLEVRGQLFIDAAKSLERQGKKLTINAVCVEAGKTPGSFREDRFPEAFAQVSYMLEKQDKHKVSLANLKEEKDKVMGAKQELENLLSNVQSRNLSLQAHIITLLSNERHAQSKLQEVTESRDRYKSEAEKLRKEVSRLKTQLDKWVPEGTVVSLFGDSENGNISFPTKRD